MANRLPYLRLYDPGVDYPLVEAWWRGHDFPPLPAALLPKLGVIAYFQQEDGTNRAAAAAWLYMDNSIGVCMMEWTVTNPQNSGRESLRAIKAMTGFLTQRALELDYTIMLTTTKQPSLGALHERNGFTKTDEGMTHYLKALTP